MKNRAYFLTAIVSAAVLLSACSPNGGTIKVNSVTLKTETLKNKISATGVVESTESKNVYSTLTYPVKSINVKVGDAVNAGDILCVIDSEDLEQQIAQKQAALDSSNTSSYYQLVESEKKYNEAKNNLDNGLNSELNAAEAALKSAKIDLDSAKAKYENAQKSQTTSGNKALLDAYDAYSKAKNNYEGKKAEYYSELAKDYRTDEDAVKAAEEKLASLKSDWLKAKDELSDAQGKDSITVQKATEKVDKAKQAYDDQLEEIYKLIKTSELEDIRKTLASYEETYDSAKQTYDEKVEQFGGDLLTYKSSYETAQVNYDKALSAYEATKLSVNQQLESYKNDLEKNKAIASNEPSVLELAALREKLNDCTVKSPIAGTVTAIYAKEGTPPNGVMFVVENTKALKIKAYVKEYDINSIAENMKVLIESDATGDDEYEGYISRISPAAQKDSSNATQFEIEVTVKTPQTKLLIGMNTRLEIIAQEKENVIGVRYDAIGTGDDGSSFVYTAQKNEKGTYTVKKVPVTTGMETDFEVEISGDGISDGNIVITDINKVRDGMTVSLSE